MTLSFDTDLERADCSDKCSGAARYVADLKAPGMLEAVTVRSTVRRGNIKSITLPELPAGYRCIGPDDVPVQNQVTYFWDPCPFFAPGSVQYLGEPLCLLVGEDKHRLRQLAAEVQVEYEEIPAIHTMEEALAGDKPPLFGSDNIYFEEGFEQGDTDEAFAKAAEIFTTTTRTGYQDHLYLETQGVLACPEDWGMTLHITSQGPHAIRNVVAAALGWETERVRVALSTVGGGFGGKIEPPMFLAVQAAIAAQACGRPVLLIYDRQEDLLCTTKRHPSKVMVRSALDEQGAILGVDMDILFQGGGYALSCRLVLDTGIKKSSGVYHFPAFRVRGRGLATNNPMPGAFRGFGVPQVNFALETHMNELARKLGREPLAMKRQYFVRQGDSTITKGKYHFPTGLEEAVDAVVSASRYAERRGKMQRGDGMYRGLGQALVKFGAPNSRDYRQDMSGRTLGVRKRADGTVEILSELMEMGQGLHTAFRKIVARTLEIPVERVIHAPSDTDRVPFLSITGSSMSVVFLGKMLDDAAKKLKPRMNESGEVTILEASRQPDHVHWDDKELLGEPFHAYTWGAFVAEVEVDPLTWQIRVPGLWVALDVGKAIDRRLVQGQIAGGAIQGLGFGLLERMPADACTGSLRDYLIPTFMDAPKVEGSIVEVPYPPGPYGAKCVGEPPLVGVGAAIADGVAEACGVEIHQLPVTPEDLMRAMRRAS